MERMMTYKELRVRISVLKSLFFCYEKTEGEDHNNIENAIMHITRDVEESFCDNADIFRTWMIENHIDILNQEKPKEEPKAFSVEGFFEKASHSSFCEQDLPYHDIYDALLNQRYRSVELCPTT